MVSEPEEWPAFEGYLEDIMLLRRSFNNSDIVQGRKTQRRIVWHAVLGFSRLSSYT
ncbi:unnamed protein product [Brassica rapa]|uniref:Uncharacterized protein n=1 Tax=Brassica campestris TaxID=3711 RepID=A0A8D9MC40_BRACM|nr:unnamed protein product [Brassica rapa]